MKYRKFGETGCNISALGFGSMRMPLIEGGKDENIDEEKAIEMIRFAIDSGVNYVDTAYGYHGGNSERIVGKALKDGYREKTYLATKSPLWNVKESEDFERILDEQMKKLNTDFIDFYLFHAVNKESWEEKILGLNLIPKMEKAKRDGKIGHIGFSFHDDLDVFKTIIDGYDGWEFCQIQFNYIDTDYQAGIEGLEYAYGKGLGVIVMEPLLGGKLASPKPQVLQALSESKTPVEWALDFVWNRPETGLLLSGMSNYRQTEDNLKYADRAEIGMLSDNELEMLKNAKRAQDSLTVVPCTHCEYCMPCPHGVNIPKVFEAFNSITTGGRRLVKELHPSIEYDAGSCKGCLKCESLCPQHIKISQVLKEIVDKF